MIRLFNAYFPTRTVVLGVSEALLVTTAFMLASFFRLGALEANFVLVRVGDGQGVFDRMQKRGVIIRPMGGYDLPEWIRISIGTPEQNDRCLAALKKALGPTR